MDKEILDNYFEYRGVTPLEYEKYEIPKHLLNVIGTNKEIRILDFGCGYGQFLDRLRHLGYTNIEGLDIEPGAIEKCRNKGLKVHDMSNKDGLYDDLASSYDFIIMNHVLEHLPKDEIVPQLKKIKTLLRPGGSLFVAVPNAQSNTGCYWAYEDFTHNVIFTSGSIYFALKAAGYSKIEYIDPKCVTHLGACSRLIRLVFLKMYTLNYRFWNKMTASQIYEPSQPIFSYEIKVMAS